MPADAYELLGVPRDADDAQRKAFCMSYLCLWVVNPITFRCAESSEAAAVFCTDCYALGASSVGRA